MCAYFDVVYRSSDVCDALRRRRERSGTIQVQGKPVSQGNAVVYAHPELPTLIQQYINDHVRQADIPEILREEHGINIKVERIIEQHQLLTTRHSGLTDIEKATAVLSLTEDDPLGRWGVPCFLGRKAGPHRRHCKTLWLRIAHHPERPVDEEEY
ncbi:hypothetical protein MKEN_01342200 [Mycena kentingensis (nom. inval.)]|nr:hypothetical protein MKEN_01342200 [Mycena kentingensis (nom. inval.)]